MDPAMTANQGGVGTPPLSIDSDLEGDEENGHANVLTKRGTTTSTRLNDRCKLKKRQNRSSSNDTIDKIMKINADSAASAHHERGPSGALSSSMFPEVRGCTPLQPRDNNGLAPSNTVTKI